MLVVLKLLLALLPFVAGAGRAHAQTPPPPAARDFPSDRGSARERAVIDAAREGIPTTPSAPEIAPPRTDSGSIRCQRLILYRGKTLNCDSHLGPDAEKLRPILTEVPAALAELENYQKGRAQVRKLAYAGGVGLGMILGGFLGSRLTSNASVARDYRTMGVGGGILVLGVTLLSGYSALGAASEHLGNAIKQVNQARPEDPIEIRFSLGIDF
jgi:hypothetical protein